MKASVTGKNQKYTALAWVLALLVLAVAIPVNLIAGRMNVSIDMTPNSIYTLTDTTEKYLNALDSKGITVDVYFLNEMGRLYDVTGDTSMIPKETFRLCGRLQQLQTAPTMSRTCIIRVVS